MSLILKGWIGVDFDGTLATYEKGMAPALGEPIPAMVERVKRWLKKGYDVRIVTARASHPKFRDLDQSAIYDWCYKHIGTVLPVGYSKDYEMIELWDDRVVQVETNTGRVIGVSRMGWK
jgi:hypothetical protein